MKNALSMVNNETGLREPTLRYHFYKQGCEQNKSHGANLLTDEQDVLLESMVLSFSACSHSIKSPWLTKIVEEVFNVTLSPSWAKRWIQGKKHLFSEKKSKHLSGKRIKSTSLDEITSFLDAFEKAINTHTYRDFNCINYDETRISIGTDGEIVVNEQENLEQMSMEWRRGQLPLYSLFNLPLERFG